MIAVHASCSVLSGGELHRFPAYSTIKRTRQLQKDAGLDERGLGKLLSAMCTVDRKMRFKAIR
jgi:hypothetical protein